MAVFKSITMILLLATVCYAVQEDKKQQIPVEVHPESGTDNHGSQIVEPTSHHEPEKKKEPQTEQNPHPQSSSEHKPAHEEQPANHQHQGHQSDVSGRQFPQMYQPMFPPPSGFNMIRRQLGGGMDILGDIVMMSMIGLPILGLLTVGSSSIANFLGFGSSSSSKSSSKRNKRSLKEKAASAVEYAKNLWDIMAQLEKAFEKYDLYESECRLVAICEAHSKGPRLGDWSKSILEIMRKQKELESREILPVAKFLFSNYADAAEAGSRGDTCSHIYSGCPRPVSSILGAEENEIENEVEVH